MIANQEPENKISTSWHSYPSIFALGHRCALELSNVPVNIEEKIDGSQFSFGLFEGGIRMRSKGKEIIPTAPERMFQQAVDSVFTLAPVLHPGWTYRAEYLQKPKHNTLAYARVPSKHLIIFDINTGHEQYLSAADKIVECQRIGLECVNILAHSVTLNIELIKDMLSRESLLGGCTLEGVVVKPSKYDLFGRDKKVVFGKFVSEAFKEKHCASWKGDNPGGKDILVKLGDQYKTQARWQKAAQHLKEKGLLESSPKDIGALIKEVQSDVLAECRDEISESLFSWAWPNINRSIIRGLPEWYKDELLKNQFTDPICK